MSRASALCIALLFVLLFTLSFALRAAPAADDPCAALAPAPRTPGVDVVWEPTPSAAVTRMLQLANTRADDVVIDLGAGDGRIPIAAAREFGASAIGVEYNGALVAYARCITRAAKLDARVTFIEGDLFRADLSRATIVTTYLLPDMNLCVRPRLLGLPPGTRVAAHRFAMADWKPDVHEVVDGADVFLWIVPARVDGAWTLKDAAGHTLRLALQQSFQSVTGTITVGGARAQALREVTLRGDALSFAYTDETRTPRAVTLTVRGDALDGAELTGARASPAPPSGAWLATAPLCERYLRR